MKPERGVSSLLEQVLVTEQLLQRPVPGPDYLREKRALQTLAAEMADHPGEMLPRLVTLAMDICDAESAGLSVLDTDAGVFRWLRLSGALSRLEGASAPRAEMPSAICIDQLAPVLMASPERVYPWMAQAGLALPEVLIVPLSVRGGAPLGTLWAVAAAAGHFHGGHARILSELANFAGAALRMIRSEERLKHALSQQESISREMNHRVKNLFALFNGMVTMAARSAESPKAMAEALSGRLKALASAHDLTRRAAADETIDATVLHELCETILRPHSGSHQIAGPLTPLGRYAANDVALVLHELATNASKYGSLKSVAPWRSSGRSRAMSCI
jgi:GAF domain-containing protein